MTLRNAGPHELKAIYDGRANLPREMTVAAVNTALDFLDPWTAAWVIDASWYQVALIQYGDHCAGQANVYPCPCGKNFTNRKGFTRHFGKCEPAIKEANIMQDLIPTHPSNRRIIEQLELHGVQIDRKKGKTWKARFPNGAVIDVLPPHIHDGNPTQTFLDIYRELAISPGEFWAKTAEPVAEEPVQEDGGGAEPTVTRGQSTQVLDILIGQGRPVTNKAMAQMTGLSPEQVSRAFYYLSTRKPPLARRIKAGMYEATQDRQPGHMVGIDVTVGVGDNGTSQDRPLDAPVAAPKPQNGVQGGKVAMKPTAALQTAVSGVDTPTSPDTTSEEEMDALIIDFLDMVFPSGFSARHLAAIDRWRAATKALFREMS